LPDCRRAFFPARVRGAVSVGLRTGKILKRQWSFAPRRSFAFAKKSDAGKPAAILPLLANARIVAANVDTSRPR
jgi:hypothetical protein